MYNRLEEADAFEKLLETAFVLDVQSVHNEMQTALNDGVKRHYNSGFWSELMPCSNHV
jgi:hypothetical protein